MRHFRTLALVLVLLGLVGCSSGGSDHSGADGGSVADAGGSAPERADAAAADADVSGPREVVTTGSLSLVVTDAAAAVDEIVTIVESHGGRVDERSETTGSERNGTRAWLTVRIPADELSQSITRIEELGEATEISLSSDDVTLRGRDLDARISALEASTERLIGLMAEAETSEALIAAEDALSERQAELEALRSERSYLSDQVAMSTLSISVSTERVVELEADGFVGGLKNGWNALVSFASGLLVALGTLLPWLVLVGVPLAVAVAVVRRRRRRRTPPPATSPATTPSPRA